MNTEKL